MAAVPFREAEPWHPHSCIFKPKASLLELFYLLVQVLL